EIYVYFDITFTATNCNYLITPPDKSAFNSPHPSSYSIIMMPPQAKKSIAQILKSVPNFMANQTAVTTTQAPSPLFFSKVSPGPGDSQLLFKQIHFFEARNNSKEGILLGSSFSALRC
ncbi:unnamed protein product, partial [Brassica oleracea var. botrytis]